MPVVVVGASWGGLAALTRLVGSLPDDLEAPVVIVQHRSRHAENLLAALLQDSSRMPVVDVEDKEPLRPARIFIAPPDYHLLVEREHLSLTTDPQVRFSRPSIDVTFISAADAYPNETIGVVLTGANDDGARGLRYIVDRGGHAIVQDPLTAESPIMPLAARAVVPEATVVPLDGIPRTLLSLLATFGRRPLDRGVA